MVKADHHTKSMAEQGRNFDFAAKMLGWYDVHARTLPWRKAGQDPYLVWLSEIMLQQTTVVVVKDYYLKFLSLWPRVEDLAAADLGDVLKAWAGLGYYARARNLHKCAGQVVAAHGGIFPRDSAALQKLPGIGPYTAAAIAAIAFDIPVAAVDGNVDRVVSRFYCLQDPLPISKPIIRDLATALVPAKRAGDFAQSMMDLGATICTPKSPSCWVCPLVQNCAGFKAGLQQELPRKIKKTKVPKRYGHVYWIVNGDGQVLVRQRPMRGLLAGMTEFPTSEWTLEPTQFDPPFEAEWKSVNGVIAHTFTHFHLELQVWTCQITQPTLNGYFANINDLVHEALPSLMRKVAKLCS